MLTIQSKIRHQIRLKQQRGVVLLITLITLVAMTLAAIAMVRSVDTANMIAGNLAFHQAATHAADSGIETAISWLEANNAGSTLSNDDDGNGYKATGNDIPQGSQSWDYFWTEILCKTDCKVVTLPTDTVGNTVQYWIQRLCSGAYDPTDTRAKCAQSVTSSSSASSMDAGTVQLLYSSQIYYRITSRVAGPRNTVSYVQATVAM